MAKITPASYIKSIHGRIGNIIFYNVSGIQYARAYSIPYNPRTEAQQDNRAAFAHAVRLWKELPRNEKSSFNNLAKGQKLSGYNLFISMCMKGITSAKLKLINSTLKSCRPKGGSVLRAGTSVIHTSLNRYTAKSFAQSVYMQKKPPGNIREAA